MIKILFDNELLEEVEKIDEFAYSQYDSTGHKILEAVDRMINGQADRSDLLSLLGYAKRYREVV
jgi:hypothetical protein